ncbi:hypothetical protein GIB67_029679 [Kingdonia uniflora]|uniref:Uncharacterized protein n=1 Tax=Kingdonia uniflora TaxID=39325 RepID=A0A7J7LLT6_9MAGN|nr:hypothetical protein GIB67_029679 [Kingdonia uniflora]
MAEVEALKAIALIEAEVEFKNALTQTEKLRAQNLRKPPSTTKSRCESLPHDVTVFNTVHEQTGMNPSGWMSAITDGSQ